MMKEIDKNKAVLVTGGSGYLASWIVKLLLEAGCQVHTTVRNQADPQKYGHLLRLAEQYPGKLRFFEANLLDEGAFDSAMSGCEVVIHTASPFKIAGIKDPQKELVEPALTGVRNVFASVGRCETVKRVVLTSSIVAVYGDAVERVQTEKGIFNEGHWNATSSVAHQPYSYSKTVAEKEAWQIAAEQSRWDLAVINPGLILGPSLSSRTDSTSISLMRQLASGRFRMGVPAGKQAFVDVRDVAQAHLLAAFSPRAAGRHIAVAHHQDFLDVAQVIKTAYPQLPLPSGYLPGWLFRLVGPLLGYSRKFIRRNIGYDLLFDNSRIRQNLGISFRPFNETVLNHIAQLKNDGLLKRA